MPFHTTADGTRLHYRLDGRPGKPLLVLGNSLGTDMFMWDRQVHALTEDFRVLRYDVRGHGASDVAPGDYSMETLGRDVLSLADHVQATQFDYAGVSLGAMTGQWLAINAPQRLRHVVLSNAAAHLPSHESWSARMELARKDGMAGLLDMVMPRFFSQQYRDLDEPYYHSVRTSFTAMSAQGYAGCCAAIRDTDFRPQLAGITVPVLVICGSMDAATPPETFGAELVDGIPNARSVTLPAGHIANIEQPDAFNRAVLDFLSTT